MSNRRVQIRTTVLAVVAAAVAAAAPAAHAAPPFEGTVFLSSDLITPDVPTALTSVKGRGRAKLLIYDDRFRTKVRRRVYRFDLRFGDGQLIKVRVNPEFRRVESARAQARKFGTYVGRIPVAVREGIKLLEINRGDAVPSASEDGQVTIPTDGTRAYEQDGSIEEALTHEGVHATLDRTISRSDAWEAAKRADPGPISTYAAESPDTEDLSESFVPWFALRFRRDALKPEDAAAIEQTIPNRLAVLDQLGLDVSPFGG